MKGQVEGRGYSRPNPLNRTASRYDTDAGLIQELRQSALPPFIVTTFDLSIAPGAAGSPYQPGGAQGGGYEFQNGLFRLPQYGRGFNGFGFTTGSATRAVLSTVLMQVGVGRPDSPSIWFQKHNRGFVGEFTDLWLGWAAQAAASMDLYIFRYDSPPFMSGEAAT